MLAFASICTYYVYIYLYIWIKRNIHVCSYIYTNIFFRHHQQTGNGRKFPLVTMINATYFSPTLCSIFITNQNIYFSTTMWKCVELLWLQSAVWRYSSLKMRYIYMYNGMYVHKQIKIFTYRRVCEKCFQLFIDLIGNVSNYYNCNQ